MIEIQGKYNVAKVFNDNIDSETYSQILNLCNQEAFAGSKIRIMPDCHAGASCVIGFTADLGDKVIPNIVGVDIGCGMKTVELGSVSIDLQKLDEVICKYIPSGSNVHEGRQVRFDKLQQLKCYRELKDTRRIERSIGTLGGGNHFIEVEVDSNSNMYLVIHTGSRNLGKQVAEYYQNLAYELLCGKDELLKKQEELIANYKNQGKRKEIQAAIKELHKNFQAKLPNVSKELSYLTGQYRENYLYDMKICQEYAELNRKAIADIIVKHMNFKPIKQWSTIHNYIDHNTNIVRKGSVSAKTGEKLLIPLNMRDGSLICVGKGDDEWNYSAPHGAGRLMSRSQAKDSVNLDDFIESMKGVYSTSVCKATLDESPFAYKPMEDIINNIGDTASIVSRIVPIYNFKAN